MLAMNDSRRKDLMYNPPALDDRQHVVLQHDGKGYLFAIFEPLDKDYIPTKGEEIEHEEDPFITSEDIEIMHDVRLQSMEQLVHFTLLLIDWQKVPKGEFRAIASASGLRVDTVHKLIAASLDDDETKQQEETKRAEKRFGMGHALKKSLGL